MSVTFKDHTFAMTNPNVRPDSNKPIIRYDNDSIGETRNMLLLLATDDQTSGINRWPARVLRVENRNNSAEGESSTFEWFDTLLTAVSPGEQPKQAPVVITAITDSDVHAMAWGEGGVGNPNFKLPTPGDPGSAKIIDKIRDGMKGKFTARTSETEVPEVGELVWVTWGDLTNRKDGQYIGPIIPKSNRSRPTPPPESSPATRSSSEAANNSDCNELNSESPNGLRSEGKNAGAKSSVSTARRRSKIDAKKERGKNPVGKGVFTGFPDIKTHKVKQATHATLNWVCYTGIKQAKEGEIERADLNKTKKFSKTYHRKGIRTYVMGYPSHGHEEAFISEIFTLAQKANAIGIIINLDHYYHGLTPSEPYERENYLMTALRDNADKNGFCIGLTATDIAKKKEAPWKIFADNKGGVDFAVPQVLSQNWNELRDQIIDKNDQVAQLGPTIGQPTYFDDIYPNNFKEIAKLFKAPEGYASLDAFKSKWYDRQRSELPKTGFKKKNDEEFNIRTLFMMGAAEIIEKYWQGIPGFENSRVFISSHYRPGGKGNHKTGGAFDVRIEYGEGFDDRVPVLQVWASLKKLQATGRLPRGGTGLYLNVSKNNMSSIKPQDAGKKSATLSGPGGSANPHYDMRGFVYSQGSKNTGWINLDESGNGKDTIKGTWRSWLRTNNRRDIADYCLKDNGTWRLDGDYVNGYIPAVGGEILNLKQLFGLESPPPPIPETAAVDPFVTYFRAWKNLGFKHIIPGLGMVGNSPSPDGWKNDGYNTPEKSPWRMREDASWTFTSVKEAIGESMANSVIWWDWDGANVTHKDWPEKRWDIIRELGDAVASAQKISNIKSSDLSEKEKNRIIGYQLGSYLRQSPSPGEDLQKVQDDQGKEQTKTPEETVPTETAAQQTPTPSGTPAEQKQQKQNEVDQLVAGLKTKKEDLEKLKTELKQAEASGTVTDAQLEAVSAKAEEIKKDEQKIQILRDEISQDDVVGDVEPTNTACPPTSNPEANSGVKLVSDKASPVGEIKSPTLNYEFKDAEFQTFPLKGAGYIVIHNPGGAGDHDSLVETLKKRGKLGIHFSVMIDGSVRQHTPLNVGCNHGSPLNFMSYSIEVMNPSKAGSPSKKFKPGPMKQYEAVYKLCKDISRNSPNFKLLFPNLNLKEGTFYFGSNRRLKGVLPHSSYVAKSDGKFSVLYMALRHVAKKSPAKAYELAVATHNVAKTSGDIYDTSTAKGWVKIPGLEPAVSPSEEVS